MDTNASTASELVHQLTTLPRNVTCSRVVSLVQYDTISYMIGHDWGRLSYGCLSVSWLLWDSMVLCSSVYLRQKLRFLGASGS